MKRPSYQWYPGDAQRDTALRSCSLAARGLWRELLDLMHDGEPYGHLSSSPGVPLTGAQLARIIGEPIQVLNKLLGELLLANVPSVTDEGVWFSRRMVRDERLRETRARCGNRGGNPILLNQTVKQEVKQEVKQWAKQGVKQGVKQKPTPAVCSLQSASAIQESCALSSKPDGQHDGQLPPPSPAPFPPIPTLPPPTPSPVSPPADAGGVPSASPAAPRPSVKPAISHLFGKADGYDISTESSAKKHTENSPFVPPAWVPAPEWTDYVAMRQRIHKPMTRRAMELAVGKLQQLAMAGQSPTRVLEQSIFNSWQGLFEVKTDGKTDRNSRVVERENRNRNAVREAAELAARRLGAGGPPTAGAVGGSAGGGADGAPVRRLSAAAGGGPVG